MGIVRCFCDPAEAEAGCRRLSRYGQHRALHHRIDVARFSPMARSFSEVLDLKTNRVTYER
jgi:hypothetical protein